MAAESPPKKRGPGRNIAEAERNTVAIKLRVPEEYRDDLDELAATRRLTRSGMVARLIDVAMGRAPR